MEWGIGASLGLLTIIGDALFVAGAALFWRNRDDISAWVQDEVGAFRRALEAGWCVLSRGGPALDAVEAAIMELEDAPVFDAGTGSHLNLDGRVECDAMVMDGASLRAGAVACVQRIRNPIRLARAVLE